MDKPAPQFFSWKLIIVQYIKSIFLRKCDCITLRIWEYGIFLGAYLYSFIGLVKVIEKGTDIILISNIQNNEKNVKIPHICEHFWLLERKSMFIFRLFIRNYTSNCWLKRNIQKNTHKGNSCRNAETLFPKCRITRTIYCISRYGNDMDDGHTVSKRPSDTSPYKWSDYV